jgi:hypothetical protein
MTHLSNDELLTAAEGGADRASHLEGCDACRGRVGELRRVLQLTAAVDVPEPSPLFWNHFSDRVRNAVAAEPLPQSPAWRFNFGWTASVAGALAIIVIGVAVTMRSAQPARPAVPAMAAMTTGENLSSLDDDPTWTLIGDLASQIDFDDASEAGLTTKPGSAEQALAEMSQEEQRQVVALLQLELQKSKSL